MKSGEQAVARQPAISSAITVQTLLGRAGGRTSNVRRILRDDPVKRQKFREEMRFVSPEEAARIVRQEAASRFRIKEDKFDLPLVGSLRFAPAEVIEFIEGLETDFGFRPAGIVSPSTASVNDLIGAFTTQ